MGEITLDWTSAEVTDGTLRVRFDGEEEASEEWRASFERTAQLLGHQTWTEVEAKKHSVRIGPVAEGDEERCKFFLDSVVLEANSDTAPPEDEAEDADGDDSAETSSEDESADSRMTGRFRDFAGPQAGPDGDAGDADPDRPGRTA